MRQPFLTILAVTILGISSSQAAVIPVLNGSFEFPATMTEWSSMPGVSQYNGWSVTNNSGFVINQANNDWFSHAADGDYLLNTPGGTTSQDLNTVLSTANTVTLTFSIAKTLTEFNNGAFVSYGQGTLTAEIFSGATLIGSQIYSATAAQGDWATFSLTALVTTPGDITIAFINNGDAPWLDNVSASYQAVVVTPEPGTMSLLAMGFVAALLVACRMRAKSVA